MTVLSRRSLLTGAAAVGVAMAGAKGASATPVGARVRTVPLTREVHRVVVIGSGFGGGVSALRLAQAGVQVTVLERGMRWPTGPNRDTFPRASAPDKRLLWCRSNPDLFGRPLLFEPYTGLIEAVAGENMTALCPAGVGGGSLVYQGMSLQPSEAVFAEHLPAELDWGLMDRVHYPRVARMLRLAVAPDELVATENYRAARYFAERVRAAGMPLAKIPMPIDWNYALAELRGEMKPSYTNGDGAMGVNNGGKHSVDVTYIAAAEATGRVRVHALHEVTDVERAPDGRWTVHVRRLDTTGATLEHKILTAEALIMAAGSVNTTRLLMRAGAKGLVPDLPGELGRGWGTNADRIYVWTDPAAGFGSAQGGPVVYGSKNWDDPRSAFTLIQASIPPLGVDPSSTMMVGYGVSDARGAFAYDSARDDAVLRWPHEGDHVIQNGHIGPAAHRIVAPGGSLLDTNALFPSTWHPLGGANMGPVCDLDGRVHGQRGLYVLDGALVPGTAAACNPSMTIAAIAERALDNIVARDIGTAI
ncbi:GMC family oxidoreductase [Nocardia puris]|uniref:GMC oxidoreductase n=1 Tax=Nocardia puris TaxID=208602 RepID=UPI0018947AF1|nr:GMC oxidoreductase [Nocardia puris]MBF6209669.1 GMC family oxidoreductase [Nocardia puris]MBF6366241.1 GMC family oxidoreductase [Nocardia puris]MBF6458420.1 GMC family oxidoreductase [Nocardia puris]